MRAPEARQMARTSKLSPTPPRATVTIPYRRATSGYAAARGFRRAFAENAAIAYARPKDQSRRMRCSYRPGNASSSNRSLSRGNRAEDPLDHVGALVERRDGHPLVDAVHVLEHVRRCG